MPHPPFPGSWQHGTLGLGGVSPHPFPTLVSCGIPVWEPATSHAGMGRQSVLQSVLTTPFTGLLGSCSAMGHQASNQCLPLAPRGPALLDPLLSGMGPPARFPPGFNLEGGVSVSWSGAKGSANRVGGGRAVGASPNGQSRSCGTLALTPSRPWPPVSELPGAGCSKPEPPLGGASGSSCQSFLLPALAAPCGRGLAQGHARGFVRPWAEH